MQNAGLEHWIRIRRWQTKLISMCDGIPAGLSREEAVDEVLTFFVLCNDLSDSLIRSGRSQSTEVKAFVDSNPSLALCRDLAVGIKHITSAAMPHVGPSGQQHCEPVPGEQWLVDTDGGSKGVFDLAVECMDAWRSYLKGVV